MKYSADQVVQGIINYADAEVMGKLPTTSKWIVGTAIGIASRKVNNVIDALRENSIVTTLDIIDEDGYIDVDDLIESMKEAAERYGNITLDLSMIGKMTFSADDVDRLRSYIR